jgi:CheY-like chemotaxis protein
MFKFLLVTPDKNALSNLALALGKKDDVQLSWAESGNKALDMVSDTPVDLVVTDEELGDMTGLELAYKLLSINPMINCAAVSPLSHDDFHEVSEGLGLLAQLPLQPGAKQAEELLLRLKDLKNLSAGLIKTQL